MCLVTDYWFWSLKEKSRCQLFSEHIPPYVDMGLILFCLFGGGDAVCVCVCLIQWEDWWTCKCHLGESSPHKNRVKDEFAVGDLKTEQEASWGCIISARTHQGFSKVWIHYLSFCNSFINLHVDTVNVNMVHPWNFLFGVNRGRLLRICKFRTKRF